MAEAHKAKRRQTTIRLPAKLKEKLQREADTKGYTVADLVMFILRNHHLTARLTQQDHPDNTQ